MRCMPDPAAPPQAACAPSHAHKSDPSQPPPELSSAGALVARRYGQRDWALRRLLALSDLGWLTAAMGLATGLAGGTRAHPRIQLLLYSLVTLPAWLVLFKMYGLYERDAKRLSHTTLDDLPPLFHALLLGCLLMWCWFLVVAPAKLSFGTVLAFACVALALVLAGRALTRAGFVRVTASERVLL